MKLNSKQINFFKGYGIILVVLGHTTVSSELKQFIYSFHMPLFYFLSGYLYNNEKYRNVDFNLFLKKKFNRLINPYIVLFIISIPLTLKKLNFNFSNMIKAFFLYGYTSWDTPIWFLVSLFISYVLFYIIDKKIYNNKIKAFTIITLFFIGYTLARLHIILPLNIISAIIGLFFFYIGNCIKEIEVKGNILILTLSILIQIIVAVFLNVNVNMVGDKYGNLFFFVISALNGIYFSMLISQKINSNIISNIGIDSLNIMCWQYYIFLIIKVFFKLIFNVKIMETTNNLKALLITIITLSIYFIIKINLNFIKRHLKNKIKIKN